MPEIYVSTDVESDGPIPGPHSMLSFASAAYTADKTLLSTFSANLDLLPGVHLDPTATPFRTMLFSLEPLNSNSPRFGFVHWMPSRLSA